MHPGARGKDQNKPELLDRADEQFDAAIQADPDNPNHYIKKSFVFAEKAALAGGDKNALLHGLIAGAVKLTLLGGRPHHQAASPKKTF